MQTLQPTLHDLYAIDKLEKFQEILRPQTPATPRKASQNANNANTGPANAGSLGNGNASGNGFGTSLSRSPRWESASNMLPSYYAPSAVTNRRDMFGRTALHLAVSSIKPGALVYVKALLDCPSISVNLQDYESGWTALHRALYAGNIAAARLIAMRPDCDPKIKDFEGLSVCPNNTGHLKTDRILDQV